MKSSLKAATSKRIALKAAALGVVTTLLVPGVAGAVDVTPNDSLPGTSLIQEFAGGLMTVVEYLLIASMVMAAMSWAWGSHYGNFSVSTRGRSAVFYILGAAVIVGAANTLINWALGANLGIA